MSVGNWVLGYVFAIVTIGVGLAHGWWLLVFGAIVFGLIWWYVPDLLPGQHEDPPEDIR